MTKSNWKQVKLRDVCNYYSDKITTDSVTLKNYISTENMFPDKAGITLSSGLPTVPYVSKYESDMILVSNIRPYFKKIWYATQNGGCSNDVLVFKAKENYYPNFCIMYYQKIVFLTIQHRHLKEPRCHAVIDL
jgi:type I restriction enzyme S subunit